jgi:hypothetical protein
MTSSARISVRRPARHEAPLGAGWAVTYEVSADRQRARMHLPPLQVAGAAKPVSIYMDLDAAAVDALLRQLAEIRAQMLSALRRN